MLKKTKILTQVFALFLLPAFVLRPTLVNSQITPLHSGIPQESKAFAKVLSSHSVFRHVEREAPDVTALNPRISKVKVPSLLDNRLSLVTASPSSSPQSFLILRI